MWVLHKCDNRKCVNPKHLFLGGAKENIADMDSKARRGTKCRIKPADVPLILALLNEGISQEKIGRAFGVSQNVISRVKLQKITFFKKD